MTPSSSRSVLSVLLGAGIAIGFGTPVPAAAALAIIAPQTTTSYSITHGFTFHVGPNTTPLVRGFDGGSAFAFSPYAPPFWSSSSYGHSYTISPPVPSLPFIHNHSTSAAIGGASATASSKVQINAIGVGTVSGFINASGTATVWNRGEVACAGSYAGVTARQRIKLPFGGVIWGPRFNWDFVSGGGCAIRKDPIKFTVTDPDTGSILSSGQFLDITSTGDGSVNWGENSLDFAISNGTFSIDLNSPFIPDNQRGTLSLKVQGGIITDSQDSGIFDGYLPAIGSSGTFSVSGSNFKPDLTFDYNLGDFGKEVDLELTADGGAIPVPESSTMNPLSLGVLGLIFLGGKRFRRSSSKK
ncbi:MAG: hypothetical protein EWV76_06100 [Microcystis novacekii Mn_MB_F_20050700_S1]|nr:MAG: hypothetical protein EWV76_06100 [Microcystis novacekii Mn_MB_F_20050700_S1]